MRKIYLFISLVFSIIAFSQGGPGGSCATIASFCGDASLPFNNVTNTPNLGNIGCLGTAPNGAWYTFQVSTPGLLNFQISQTNAAGNGIDVDFICWGPFTTDPRLNPSLCTTSLQDYPDGQNAGAGNIVACSYSAAPVENFSIPNAIAGNFYVVLITNFSNQSGSITFDQTNNTGGSNGSTNCEICGVSLGPDRFICNSSVTSVNLTANFYSPPVSAVTLNYSWYLNGVLQTTTTSNTLTVTQNGVWRVEVDRVACTPTEYDEIIVDISSGIASNTIGPFNGAPGDCNPTFDLLSYLSALMSPSNPANYTYEFYDLADGSLIPDPANFTPTSTTTVYVKIIQGTCEGSEFIDFNVDCVPSTCSLVLNSPTSTSNQAICINQAITDIIYNSGGDATGVTVTGLPTGLTATFSAGQFTISGIPTQSGVFNYMVETVGCSTNIQLTGTITINSIPPPPTLNTVFSSCTSNGSNIINNYNATYTYTFSPLGPTVGSSGEILGAIIGTSYTVVANNSGCNSLPSAPFTDMAMLASPVQPTTTSVAPTCSADGSSTISNYNGSLTYTFTPAGPTVGAGGLISGMTVGTSYTVVSNNGNCDSVASAGFSNSGMLSTPVQPTITSVSPTCSSDGTSTISNYNGSLTYLFTPAGPTVGAGGLISGMTVGTSYTVIADNGSCSSVASASFSNAAMLASPVQPTISSVSPTCSADGSSTISNYNAGLTYIFTPAGPTVGAGGLISGMTVGTSYTVVSNNGNCDSVASAGFSNSGMLSTPVQPTITYVSPTCSSDGTSTISNYNGSLTYLFTPAGPTVGAGGLVSGMTVGTSYTVIADNGSCSSVASASFSNAAMLVSPVQPTTTSVAPTCSADGSSTISNYNAGLTYIFTPAGPTVGAGGLISGMTVGTSYTVVSNNGNCDSVASAGFSNSGMLSTPVQPTITYVSPTCSSDGTSTISNYNSSLTYLFTPAGPTVGAGGLISGMTVGTSYTVIADNGSCSSVASASFSNAAMLASPVQPTISSVSPTCSADGSSTISNYNAGLTYIFTPAGPTVGAGGLISGMTVGTSYTVVSNNGNCDSVASAGFSNSGMLSTPVQPTITSVSPTCSSDGTSTISNYNGSLTYLFTPAGPTVGAGGLISGMTVGTSYTVIADNGSCSSVASASFSNAAMLASPVQPTISSVSPTCSADGSSTISNYNAGLTYIFTPAGPTVGAGGLISGMTVGTSYTVVSNNGNCDSVASAGFSNSGMLSTPVQPTITYVSPTCSSDGTSTISNYNGSLTYLFTPAGPTVGAGGLVSGMTVGTSYTVIADNGSCSSVASASFSNAAMLVSPVQPTTTSVAPTCSADGSSTISNYNAGLTYIFTPAGPTVGAGGLISGMTVGTSYTVVSNNGNCDSVASAGFSNSGMLSTPVQPTITYVSPTCSSDGTSTISNYNGSLTYLFTPAGPTVGAGGLVSGMTVGTSYTVIADNGSCSSVASASFSNAAMLVSPVQPTTTSVAPTCSADGSSTISNYNAGLTYIFTPAGPTVGAGGLISGMTVGTNYTVVSNNGNCDSVASAGFSNSGMLSTPVQPTITSVSPTCSSDGTSTISNYNAGLTYTFTPAGPTVGSGGLISGMTVGTSYTVIADNGSCSSVASLPFIKVQSTPAPTLTITNNTPSICSGSSTDILLTSNVPGTIFSWNAVGTNVSGSTNGTGTSINQILTTTSDVVGEVVYTVIATANGCSAPPQEVRVYVNPVPDVVVTPTSETICSGTSTNISFSGSIPGTVFNWTVVQSGVTGATSGTGTSIIDVLNTSVLTIPGTATYTITPVLNGCSGTPVDVIVTVNPTPEILGTPTHLPICSGEFTNINVSAMDPATVFDYTVSAVGVIGATGGTITAGAPIAQQLETISNSQGYVDYTITPTLNGCSGTPIVIRVYVNPLPLPVLEDGVICVELSTGNVFQTYYFHTGLSNSTHTFVWYYEGVIIPGATSTSYEATAAGSYSVIATNIATGCSSLEVFGTVNATNPATSFTYTVTNAFTDNATIVVNVPDGNGTIMYQIDDEALQSSNIFTGVSPGMHVITVVDTQGCTYLTEEVMVIDYPKYFTPNGDGYNDYWNIIGLQNQPGAKLYIFDRYGKLIKQISTTGQGWDGTFNNQQLPSTDYWFTVEFEEAGQQKVFRAHFSLIR